MQVKNTTMTIARCRTRIGLALALVLCLSTIAVVPLVPAAHPVHAAPTSFGQPVLFDAATWTTSVAMGDIDGRNGLDIVVGNRAAGGIFSSVSSRQNLVFLNDGAGNFYDREVDCDNPPPNVRCFGTGDDATWSIALGDVDGRNGLDIVVGNGGSPEQGDSQDAVYLNDGNGNFDWEGSRQIFGPDQETLSIALGDLDGKNGLDIIIGRACCVPNEIYFNDGSGHFGWDGGVVSFGPTNKRTSSIAVGDINGDQLVDIAVGHETSGIGRNIVYFNDKSAPGNFHQGDIDPMCNNTVNVVCFGSNDTSSLALGDINGDNKLDIVVGTSTRIGDGQNRIYFNSGGSTPNFIGTNFGPGNDGSLSVAVADIDNDNDLDIIVGNGYPVRQQNVVYLNQEGTGQFYNGTEGCGQTAATICLGAGFDVTDSLGIADLNGDGYLDIVTGNGSQEQGEANVVYFNAGMGDLLPPPEGWRYGNPDVPTMAAAVGDVNNDGNLDIVIANRVDYVDNPDCTTNPACDPRYVKQLNQNAVYLGNGEGRFDEQLFGSGDDWTYSVALGDLDGDRDLDIVIGSIPYFDRNCAEQINVDCPTQGGQNYIYMNNNGDFTAVSSVRRFGTGTDWTFSVALGDVDGDTDLDIVVGNAGGQGKGASFLGEQNVVYLNDGDGNFASGADVVDCSTAAGTVRCVGDANSITTSVALGDIDGDGDLDIAVGNGERTGQQNVVYLNDSVGNFNWEGSSRLFGPVSRQTDSLALKDLDGDGSLDIVSGGAFQPSYAYLNDGNGYFNRPDGLRLIEMRGPLTTRVIAADFDGNGAIDIATSIGLVYRNDGAAHFTPSHEFPVTRATALAAGDLDADGDMDIVTAHQVLLNGSSLSRSRQNPGKLLPNNAPWVAITKPKQFTTGVADLFSTTEVFEVNSETSVIEIPFTLFDPESDPVRAISATFSLDGGANWRTAIPSDTQTTNLATSPNGAKHVFRWDVFASKVFGRSDNVVFRIVVYPITTARGGGVPGPYQRPYASAVTFPFRVRGTQVQVFGPPEPPATPPPTGKYKAWFPLVLNRPVAAPPANAVSDRGAVVYRLLLDGRSILMGTTPDHPFRTNPEGYLEGRGEISRGDRLVALWPIAESEDYTVYLTNAQPNTIDVTATTVLTPGVQHLTISANNPLIVFDLDASLEWDARADKEYLTQLEGRFERTSELLYDWTNGQVALGRVSVYDNKQHWDSVDIQIYASNRIRPNANQGGIADAGQVRMGAIWSRYGETTGTLGEDWSRALAHELGHYLFFLDDNYLGLDSRGLLTPISTCPGAMSDPYRDDQSEFHPRIGWKVGSNGTSTCDKTLAEYSTARWDWQTIVSGYPWLKQPNTDFTGVNSGPSNLPMAVTRVITSTSATTAALPLETPIFYLFKQDGSRFLASNRTRAFLFQRENDKIINLIDLGRPAGDQILARGARPGDRLCVYDLLLKQLGCIDEIETSNARLELKPVEDWQPEIIAIPAGARAVKVKVSELPAMASKTNLKAQLFPAGGSVVSLSEPMYISETASFEFTFPITTTAVAGFVRIWIDGSNPLHEVVADYGVGGGPAQLSIGTEAPVISPDGQAILYGSNLTFAQGQFYTLQTATRITCPPEWAKGVGQAYHLTTSDPALIRNTSINFSYLGRDVSPGEEHENWLNIYFLAEEDIIARSGVESACTAEDVGKWKLLNTSVDTKTNTAVAATEGRQGIYMLTSSIEIPLKAGWNLFAYTIPGPPRPITQALKSIEHLYPTVLEYDTSTGQWKTYDSKRGIMTLRELTFGHGYWIQVPQDTTLWLKGADDDMISAASAIPDQSAFSSALKKIPPPPATYYGTVLADGGFTPKAGMVVVARVNGNLCGRGQTIQKDHKVVYLVHVDADNARAPGCGTAGRQVTFQVGVTVVGTTAPWASDQPYKLSLSR
jgi:FG-GAP-like repeat